MRKTCSLHNQTRLYNYYVLDLKVKNEKPANGNSTAVNKIDA